MSIIVNTKAINLAEYLTEDKLKEIENPPMGNPTGIAPLDFYLRGISPGFYVLSAPRGVGKTWFALQLIHNLYQTSKIKSMFFTLEMTVNNLTSRCLQAYSGLTEDEFRAKKDTSKGKALLKEGILTIHPTYDVSIDFDSFEAEVEQNLAKGIKFFVLDHIHLLPGAGGRNRDEVIGDWSEKVRALINRLNVPIMFIAQPRKLNNPKKVVDADDIKGSGSLADAADVIITMSKERTDPKAGKVTECWVSIEKNRLGGHMFEGFYLEQSLTGFFELGTAEQVKKYLF